MNQTQRKFIVERAIEILIDKLVTKRTELIKLDEELRENNKITARGVHRLIAAGKIPLKTSMPKDAVHEKETGLNAYFDTEALDAYIASKKAKYLPRLKGSHKFVNVQLFNPFSKKAVYPKEQNRYNSLYVLYEELYDLQQDYQQRLEDLTLTLMLKSEKDALQLLEDLKAI